MNVLVLLFYVQNVLASLLLGGKFVVKRDPVFKHFGLALLFDAVAFAIWSAAVITKPDNIEEYVSFGTMAFIVSLLFLLMAGTQRLQKGARFGVLIVGAIAGLGIFLLGGMPAYPSTPGFSPEGFFFFNVHPLLQTIYVFVFALTAIPAIEAVASKFKGSYAWLIRYGFILEVAGGMLLITAISQTANSTALYLIGWTIGIVYFVLAATLLFNRKAWAGAN